MLSLMIYSGLIFALFIGAGIVFYILSLSAEKKNLVLRTGDVVSDGASHDTTGFIARDMPRSGFEEFIHNTRFHKYLSHEFQKAKLGIKVSEFVTLSLLLASVPSAVSHYVLEKPGLTVILFVIGLVLPAVVVKQRQAARKKAFGNQLLDSILMISNSIKSGYSFLQAIDLAGKEMPDPIGEEFKRVIHDSNYGIPFESAVQQLADRMENEDLDLILTSVMIQRKVGGNLAEVLDKIAYTIRERSRVKGEIKTLTAQGRLSGIILSLLPVVVGLALLVINPEYITILFTTTAGRILLLYALGSQIIGTLLIQKIVSIEV